LLAPTGSLTPVESSFTPASAPALGANPSYLHTTVAAAFDSRPAADYARRGALVQVTHQHFADTTYDFSRLDAEVVQHLPILRENWVISLHGRLESSLGDDPQVPYFLLPSLGSGSTLRAFSSWRFRDRHAVLMSGEFRWIVSRLALDMALFADAGTVAPQFDALTTGQFVSDVGIGVRFHGPARTPLRVEIAHGREGVHLVFAASAAF
jgi:outer membrane protein assembly factor BamA